MSLIYVAYRKNENQGSCLLIEDEETAQLYVKMGIYNYYEPVSLVTSEDLADDIFEYYAYLRDGGVDDMLLSDEELKKKITEDSDGAITYD